MAVVYASGRNKWEAIANVMLMTRLYAEGYTTKYTALRCRPGKKRYLPEVHAVSERIAKRQQEWLEFSKELEDQRLSKSFVDIFSVSRQRRNAE